MFAGIVLKVSNRNKRPQAKCPPTFLNLEKKIFLVGCGGGGGGGGAETNKTVGQTVKRGKIKKKETIYTM